MLDAARAKARRGELRISVPVGYSWHREAGLGLDPDLRVREAVRLIFARPRRTASSLTTFFETATYCPRTAF